MKTCFLSLALVILISAPAAKAQIDPVAIYICQGTFEKNLPNLLHVSLTSKKIGITQLHLSAARLFDRANPSRLTYVSKSSYSSSEPNVLIWTYQSHPYSGAPGTLEVTMPTPIGTMSKTYQCKATAVQG